VHITCLVGSRYRPLCCVGWISEESGLVVLPPADLSSSNSIRFVSVALWLLILRIGPIPKSGRAYTYYTYLLLTILNILYQCLGFTENRFDQVIKKCVSPLSAKKSKVKVTLCQHALYLPGFAVPYHFLISILVDSLSDMCKNVFSYIVYIQHLALN